MKRKFIVAAQGLTKSEQRDFISYLRAQKVAWWHWISGVWLIVDQGDQIELEDMRSHLRKTSASRAIAIEVGGDKEWAGFGPSGNGKDMFQWLHDAWDE